MRFPCGIESATTVPVVGPRGESCHDNHRRSKIKQSRSIVESQEIASTAEDPSRRLEQPVFAGVRPSI